MARNQEMGYTGNMHEQDLVGFKLPKKMIEAFKKEVKPGKNGKPYISFADSIRIIRSNWEGDPTNPEKDFGRELLIALREKLGFESDEDIDKVKFYSASQTPLDFLHGTDAFVVIGEKEKKAESIITVDATLRPSKLEGGHKADVMVGSLPDPEEDEYVDKISVVADQVVRAYRSKQETDGPAGTPHSPYRRS